MRSRRHFAFGLSLCLALSVVSAERAGGATYLPLSDEALARRSPVIVRAQVIGQETRVSQIDGGDAALTVTRFGPLEVLKGRIPVETFEIALPGGTVGDVATWIPGTPSFAPGSEVLLFLSPPEEGAAGYRLTEFGLSKFDVVQDRGGRRFAVRPVFRPEEDDVLSLRAIEAASNGAAGRTMREAESFAASLRSVGSGREFPPVSYSAPDGEPRAPQTATPAWANLGGEEGTSNLFRWFWDTGRSPAARVTSVGTQSGLSDGSNGLAQLQNAVTQWASVAGANVLYSQSSGSAPVVVNFDVDSRGSYWSAPLPCASGGVIGLGGPGNAVSAGSFKGDAHYYAVTSATVWMRTVTGGCYDSRTFRTAVLHELGHTLGLAHPDQGTSIHSTTTPDEWLAAVMVSSIPPSRPSTPQSDDIQAILWLYGGSSVVAAPAAAFGVSSDYAAAGQPVAFTDASTGSPTSWSWNFGDGSFSTLPNPSHAYAASGTYLVTLTVSNAGGSNTASRTVTVSSCFAAAGTLCLNNGRFRAQVAWRAPSQGAAGIGTAVPLTGDTGYFWFFTPNNVELVVKAVDGRAVNGDFWVFYGALSDVEYMLTVTDTVTGVSRSYFNPAGTLASVADTRAFSSAGATIPARARIESPRSAGSGPTAAGTLCSADPNSLCLSGGRFDVRVAWRVPSQGTSGIAEATPLTGDTGRFWFFTANNIELVVKVVDGRAVNGRFWVFSGALSNVEYTITVTDMVTGLVKTYTNPSGSLTSIADTSAF
jgi:PKD repeat protein